MRGICGMEIVEKRTIKLTWDNVCQIVSEEIKTILGIETDCKATYVENEYWDVSFLSYRLPLQKLCQLLYEVQASSDDWEDTLSGAAIPTVPCLGMALSEKLLARHLNINWEHSFILADSLWLVGTTDWQSSENDTADTGFPLEELTQVVHWLQSEIDRNGKGGRQP